MRSLVHPPLILIKSWWQIQIFLDRMAIAGNGEANLLLPPENEVLGQGNFLHLCVIPEGGGVVGVPACITDHMTGDLHPRGYASMGWAYPSWDTWDTTGYGQQAGGTHPTEMHSCLSKCLPKSAYKWKKLDRKGGISSVYLEFSTELWSGFLISYCNKSKKKTTHFSSFRHPLFHFFLLPNEFLSKYWP